jgi:hypothetical protein
MRVTPHSLSAFATWPGHLRVSGYVWALWTAQPEFGDLQKHGMLHRSRRQAGQNVVALRHCACNVFHNPTVIKLCLGSWFSISFVHFRLACSWHLPLAFHSGLQL